MRNATFNRFHPLMTTTANVSSASSFSLNSARACHVDGVRHFLAGERGHRFRPRQRRTLARRCRDATTSRQALTMSMRCSVSPRARKSFECMSRQKAHPFICETRKSTRSRRGDLRQTGLSRGRADSQHTLHHLGGCLLVAGSLHLIPPWLGNSIAVLPAVRAACRFARAATALRRMALARIDLRIVDAGQ